MSTIDKTVDAGREEEDDEGTAKSKVEPLPKRSRKKKEEASNEADSNGSTNGQSKTDQQALEAAQEAKKQQEKSREQEINEASEALDALSPQIEPVRRMIGKPPEMGGKENQYSIYVQDMLPWMDRQVFFSHVGRTFADAIKATGGDFGGMNDVFGDEGSIIERGRALTQRDFGDAASFLTLAFELVAHSPMFLVDCYVIILAVPRDERRWARARFAEPWKPENDQWGLKDEEHEDIIQTFIDQNYEEIRRFFVETLPAMGRRLMLHEKSKDRQSESDQSK
jgi:hypothetical protein